MLVKSLIPMFIFVFIFSSDSSGSPFISLIKSLSQIAIKKAVETVGEKSGETAVKIFRELFNKNDSIPIILKTTQENRPQLRAGEVNGNIRNWQLTNRATLNDSDFINLKNILKELDSNREQNIDAINVSIQGNNNNINSVQHAEQVFINSSVTQNSSVLPVPSVVSSTILDSANSNSFIQIPLDGCTTEGDAKNINGSYLSGKYQINAAMKKAKQFAAIFIDLTQTDLPKIKRNNNKTYDLQNCQFEIKVRSSEDFTSSSNAPNGVELFLKREDNGNWQSWKSDWIPIKATLKSTGMILKIDIPNDYVCSEVSGISIKFTIGDKAKTAFNGSFLIDYINIYN